MKIGVVYFESDNVEGASINQKNRELVAKLAQQAKVDMDFIDVNDVDTCDLVFSFIGGGGTEGNFSQVYKRLPEPMFLLTTGANNSLAASMEILSFLRQQDIEGEIIHGSEEYMVNRISTIVKCFTAINKLSNYRIGRVGKPSDWLISSNVDAKESKETNGIEIVDIDMQEFFDEIAKKEYVENEFTKAFLENRFDEAEKQKALEIYGALRRIVDKYQLNGVTVRCFDLLKPVKGTGCVALAILNAEGIYASCEGDTPSLISMAILGELTGEPCFQANPSRILTDSNEIVFAHCTLPVNMYDSCELMTHFESGLGVAFRGKIKEGPITVFKTDGLAQRYFVSSGTLAKNLSERNLCRTQVLLKLDEDVNYFLTESIGNHHIIIKGDYVDLIHEFFRWF